MASCNLWNMHWVGLPWAVTQNPTVQVLSALVYVWLKFVFNLKTEPFTARSGSSIKGT